MILLVSAALLGCAAGILRARIGRHPYAVPNLRLAWLVLLAFLPQFFAFLLPATRSALPRGWVSVALVSSQVFLLIFAGLNLRRPGFSLLAAGLVLNLTVILLNGGLMPISPETIQTLFPTLPAGSWELGQRFGTGKDVVLLSQATRLWFLSDHLWLPGWIPYRAAFSPGDVLIAGGAFWLLFASGRISLYQEEVSLESART